jgi:hypothetical protein
LSVILSAANANDATMVEAVLDDIPSIRMPSGRRRRRPGKVHADKAYDHRRCRAYLRRRGIRSRIARRMIESSERLGRHRWTIERTGHGLAASGGCGSATSVVRSGSLPCPCWLVRSSVSTRSSSGHDERLGSPLENGSGSVANRHHHQPR